MVVSELLEDEENLENKVVQVPLVLKV